MSREVRSLLFPALGSPRNSGNAGRGRRKRASRESLTETDGARRPFVCCRGAGALGPVAPAQARVSSRRLPDSPARAPARPPPVLPPPRLRPSPAPSLARGPPPAAARGTEDHTGDRPLGTQTKRQPHLSSPLLHPLRGAWSRGSLASLPGTCSLQGPCRSRRWFSLLQG